MVMAPSLQPLRNVIELVVNCTDNRKRITQRLLKQAE